MASIKGTVVVIYFYLFLSSSFYLYIFLSISIYFFLFLSISIYFYLFLFISINFYLFLSISFYFYLIYFNLFLSISIYFFLFLSISIYFFLFLCYLFHSIPIYFFLFLSISGGLNGMVPLELESPKLNYYFVPIIIITIRNSAVLFILHILQLMSILFKATDEVFIGSQGHSFLICSQHLKRNFFFKS